MKTLFATIDTLQDAMTFHRERQGVLAGNVANVDTPGYRPLDLERLPAMEGAGGAGLATTNPRHISAGDGVPGAALTFDDAGTTAGADGNAVNLERELAKIDANRTRYTASSELVSRRMALLRYTAGDGNA
jgi:flagellar basal-body rod protein FlgB